MAKYRIIARDSKFYVQRRLLWVLWVTLGDMGDFDFDTIEDARAFAVQLRGFDARRHPMRVVETL